MLNNLWITYRRVICFISSLEMDPRAGVKQIATVNQIVSLFENA